MKNPIQRILIVFTLLAVTLTSCYVGYPVMVQRPHYYRPMYPMRPMRPPVYGYYPRPHINSMHHYGGGHPR